MSIINKIWESKAFEVIADVNYEVLKGVGTIIKVDSGNNNYVSVDFGKLGVKTLSLNIAPLQILKK